MSSEHSPAEPPLWSIGIVAIMILVAPLILYSLAPTGPLREGDTVFSDGEQRVQLITPSNTSGSRLDDTCLLDPDSPLIIAQVSDDPANPSIVAHVQGNQPGEWPFCPVHAEVRLHTRQIFQKPPVFGSIREILTKGTGWNSTGD
ncbi:hypothetical protein [Candidatus Nitrospira inopinata]|uniref:Uncharacterized protein n=1 Tax=Candidatus Nitrospira inopinata TaxID=1715989 RepID=A0A0S4KQN1_9BACT|nr:hypothetical protein [Candidatus Nitrospira inopinata]CUQ66293.1 conserved protein of unknown function [Candidatus Nitrospira inopinata]